MGEHFRPVTINFASVHIPGGVAGLPLLAIVIVVAIALPEARWLLLFGLTAGALFGGIKIFLSHERRSSDGEHDEHGGHRQAEPAGVDDPRDSRRGAGHRWLVSLGDVNLFVGAA